jgi:hypothetical protein
MRNLDQDGLTRYDAENDQIVRETYFGNVLSIYPSGKYYTPFARSNVEPCPKCHGEGTIKNIGYDAATYEATAALEQKYLRDMRRRGKHYKIMPKQWQREIDQIRQVIRLTEPHIECPCCYGMGSREAYEDQVFDTHFTECLAERNIYVAGSEGDGCDMIVGKVIEREDLKTAVIGHCHSFPDKPFYPSDIGFELGIDLKLMVEIFTELMQEGKITTNVER